MTPTGASPDVEREAVIALIRDYGRLVRDEDATYDAILSALSSDRRVEEMRERCAKVADQFRARASCRIAPETEGMPLATVKGNIAAARNIASAIRSLPVGGESDG